MKNEQVKVADCPAQIEGKPNVGCCTTVETAMQCHISRLKQLRDIYQIGTPQHNCFSITINEAMVEMVKEKVQLVDAFTAGQIVIGNLLIEHFNKKKWFFQSKHSLPENDKEDGIEYFNNTFY